jgi:hypothetical protein
VNDRVKVFLRYFDLLSFEEFRQVDPVVLFLIKLETVIELIHFDVIWVVALKNFCENPTVRQVPLRVVNFVGEVE